ncbi:MAG TPA: DUF5668 domain-containing protein [Candidatus Binatia bacterium]|nr:DUF5668 domain-containing protein [Candidatus Binatia bacterium]
MAPYYRRRGLVGPAMLITLGAILMADRLWPGEFGFSRLWPLILIVIGLVRLLEMGTHSNEPSYPPAPTPAPGPPPPPASPYGSSGTASGSDVPGGSSGAGSPGNLPPGSPQ